MTTNINIAIPWIWSFILFSFNAYILYRECKNRKNTDVKFTTKPLKYWSILCIIIGCVSLFSGATLGINGLCYFSLQLWLISYLVQQFCMGLYQLSRLYYCFANNQIYSNKGYPKWIFIFMVIIGALIVLISTYSVITIGIMCQCGLHVYDELKYERDARNILAFEYVSAHFDCRNSDDLEYKRIYEISIMLQDMVRYLRFPSLTLAAWDILTLSLYYYKVRQFMKLRVRSDSGSEDGNKLIYNRILSIMNKIIILTLFYEIWYSIGIIFTWIFVKDATGETENGVIDEDDDTLSLFWYLIYVFILWTVPFIFSLSMYLMMDHNHDKYIKFLECVRCSYLSYICCACCYCCCGWMVDEQLSTMTEIELGNQIETQTKNATDNRTDSMYDTRNTSQMHDIQKVEYHDCELSVTNIN